MKRQYAIYMGLATEFVGLMAVFIFLGNWFDERFGMQGFGLIIGMFIALTGWSVHFALVLRGASREALENPEKERNNSLQ